VIVLKKIWAFLKTHWYIPVIIVIAIIFRSKNASLLKIVDAQKKSYDKQKAAIENAEKEKQEARVRIEEEYEKATQKVELEYAKMNKEISNRQKDIIKKTVKKFHSEPDALAKELSKKFGIRYVPNKNN